MIPYGLDRSRPFEIMVVDDNPNILKLLSDLLVEKGYRVRTAISGKLALRSIASQPPDLILLDVKMPEMDGFEVSRYLKSKRNHRNIPIIFISALDKMDQKIEGFKAGGVDYITKPFQSEEVLVRVKTHLKLKELTEHLEQKVVERTAEITQTNQILRREIQQRCRTELALQKARNNLERMVEKRTAELTIKNLQLKNEIDRHHKTEVALSESEIKYRTIFETTAAATMIVEEDDIISLINTEFERLFGYSKAQIEGKTKWMEFIVEEDLEMMQTYHRLRHIDPDAAPRNYECRVKGKNGQVRNMYVTVALMPGTGKSVVSLLDVSKLKNVEQNLRESESRLRYLSSCLLAAQENERQRIAMEIHDELGQNLAVLKLQLNSLAKRLRKDQGPLKADYKKVLGFIDYIIEEMRRISRDLSPSIVQDLKLCRSLKWMLHDFNKHNGVRISHKMIDIDTLFDAKEQVIIYRIFQEALNNIRKHARAQNVKVAIYEEDKHVHIAIEDDGRGFDPNELKQRHPAERGLGIASLEERARMLGGSFSLTTEKGKGTCLAITIPIGLERGLS
jgi:PAS domain S-box-containing protein